MPATAITNRTPILVTGGSGYIASWIIKYLLDDGYTVHATVRSINDDRKTAHLKAFAAKAKGRLSFFEADLLQPGTFDRAMKGCAAVIHTASPFKIGKITDAKRELIDPALEGTRNVLDAVDRTSSVKSVVLTSSVAAIYGDAVEAGALPDRRFTEEHWNATSSLTHQPYSYSKTVAEREAWIFHGRQKRWRLAVINPGFVMGPSLSKRVDGTSVEFFRSIVTGRFKTGVPHFCFGVVDVRDVARAHIAAVLNPKAAGRHILVAESVEVMAFAAVIESAYPGRFSLPKGYLPTAMLYLVGPFMGMSWKNTRLNIGHTIYFDNGRSKKLLGIKYRPFDETIRDHVQQLVESGLA